MRAAILILACGGCLSTPPFSPPGDGSSDASTDDASSSGEDARPADDASAAPDGSCALEPGRGGDPPAWPPDGVAVSVRQVEVHRLDCDAADDLLIASDPALAEDRGFYVMRGRGRPDHGNVFDGFVSTGPAPPNRLAVAQVGGSEQPEILMATLVGDELQLWVYPAVDATTYGEPYTRIVGETPATSVNPFLVAVGDFDGDEEADFLVGDMTQLWTGELVRDGGSWTTGELVGLEGPSAGLWDDASIALAVPSADAPGLDDIVVTRFFGATLLRNDGRGGFPIEGYASAGGESATSTTLWDFDGDGVEEVVATQVGDPVYLLVPREGRVLTLGATGPSDLEPYLEDFQIGDLGGSTDRPDLVWSDARSGTDVIYLLADLELQGGTEFTTQKTLKRWDHPAGSNAGRVVMGDFDGDGTRELLAFDGVTGETTCLRYDDRAGQEGLVPCDG